MENNNNEKYEFKTGKAIIFLLIIIIGLIIFFNYDEWKQKQKEKQMINDAVKTINDITNNYKK